MDKMREANNAKLAEVNEKTKQVQEQKRKCEELQQTVFSTFKNCPLMTIKDKSKLETALLLGKMDIAAEIMAKYITMKPEEKNAILENFQFLGEHVVEGARFVGKHTVEGAEIYFQKKYPALYLVAYALVPGM